MPPPASAAMSPLAPTARRRCPRRSDARCPPARRRRQRAAPRQRRDHRSHPVPRQSPATAQAANPGAVTGFPLDTSFRPRRWLRGRHFQTILPSLPLRRARVERRAVAAAGRQRGTAARLRRRRHAAGISFQPGEARPRARQAPRGAAAWLGGQRRLHRTCCHWRRPCLTPDSKWCASTCAITAPRIT